MRTCRAPVNPEHRGTPWEPTSWANQDWEKHFQKQRVATSYFKGLLQLQPGTALPRQWSSLPYSTSTVCTRGEIERKILPKTKGSSETPCEGSFKGRRKEIYFFLASLDKQWKESGHQEAFFEEKSAFAWISALASLKTIHEVNMLSPAMQHFLRPISFLIWLPFPSCWYTRCDMET